MRDLGVLGLFGLLPALSEAALTTCKQIQPTRSNAACGTPVKGFFRAVDYNRARQILDLDTCSRICGDLSDEQTDPSTSLCTEFIWNSTSNLCIWYRDPYYSGPFLTPDSQSTTFVYDRACFDCETDCEPPTDFNLLNNGDFGYSSKLVGPWQPFDGFQPRLVPDSSGARAITYVIRGNRQGKRASLDQQMPLCPNMDYQISFDLKIDQLNPSPSAPSDNAAMYFYVTMADLSYSRIINFDDPFLGAWHSQTASFHFGSIGGTTTSQLQVEIVPGTKNASIKHRVTMRNFKVTRLESGTFNVTGDSLVQNGDFESNRVAPWSDPSYAVGTSYTGSQYTECKTADFPKGMPVFTIVTPGLAQSGIAPASAHALRFCGQGTDAPAEADTGLASVTIAQPLTVSWKQDKNYVVRFEYKAYQSSNLPQVSIGPYVWNSDVYRSQWDRIPAELAVFQRFFSGAEMPSNTSLELLFYGQMKGDPTEQLNVFLDNVGIYEMDA